MGKKKKPIAVLGAGFAGALTTLALLKEGHFVVLKDMNKRLFGKQSSSQNECFKLHTGMHYLGDLKTAEQCLLDSIGFARAFPDCILGHNDSQAPWRRGLHCLVSESLFDLETARNTAAHLRKVYQTKVTQDPRNEVFGPPSQFILEQDPELYPDIATNIPCTKEGAASTMQVLKVFQTGESQIDIDALRAKLIKEFEPYITNEQLIIQFSTTVISIEHDEDSLDFIVYSEDEEGAALEPLEAEMVINCTWQNIEKVEKNLHIVKQELDETLIRLKTSILVKLPDSLTHFNTCIFSVGPFCSITNLNGTAVLTYEPTTNIGSFKAGETPSDELLKIMNEQLSPTEGYGQKIAKEIVEGCAQFLSQEQKQALLDCEVLEVRLGYVRMHKHANEVYTLGDANSPIHRRPEHGIEQAGLGYIRFASMKMSYADELAKKIPHIIKRHSEVKKQMETAFELTTYSSEDEAKHGIKAIRNIADHLIILHDAPGPTQIQAKLAQFWTILTQNPGSPLLTAQRLVIPSLPSAQVNSPVNNSNSAAPTVSSTSEPRPSKKSKTKGFGCAIS